MREQMEIERKFVPRESPQVLEESPSVHIQQGYVAILEGEVEVRLRRTDDATVLTVKRGSGEVRREEEIDLSEDQFRSLWPLTEGARVEKRRYSVPHGKLTFEVDVFEGALSGMVMAEVEFDSERESEAFRPPDWLGDEVTGDGRYANESLALRGAPTEAQA